MRSDRSISARSRLPSEYIKHKICAQLKVIASWVSDIESEMFLKDTIHCFQNNPCTAPVWPPWTRRWRPSRLLWRRSTRSKVNAMAKDNAKVKVDVHFKVKAKVEIHFKVHFKVK